MRITIVCDQFTLEDVKALGQYLRDRYKDSEKDIRVLVVSQEVPVEEAVAALGAIFEEKGLHGVRMIYDPFEEDGGNGNK